MILVLQGYALGSLWRWGDGGGGAPAAATTITGKLVRPILTHWTNITTSWWWLALVALGMR